MNFAALEIDARKAIDFDAESPVFQFPDGQAGHFKAFKLPIWQGPLQITLRSRPVAATAGKASVLWPVIRFLDGSFRETRKLIADPERHWHQGGFMFTAFVNEADRGERYFVVHGHHAPTDRTVKERTYSPSLIGLGVLAAPMQFAGEPQSVAYQFADEGPLEIEFHAYGKMTVDPLPAGRSKAFGDAL